MAKSLGLAPIVEVFVGTVLHGIQSQAAIVLVGRV